MNHDIKYFIYCRKSSEDSQQQIGSIEDQINALNYIVKRENLYVVSAPFREEKSAKAPGRPIFNDMLKRINNGEANALICWDFDRLSRNPIDGGQLQWMLQKGVIKVIRTPNKSYYPMDAGLLLSIEGGQATQFLINLSRNVKRGLDSRAEQGWRPLRPLIGYLNSGHIKGAKTIIADPERFLIVRKMWDLLLSGGYSVDKILKIATDEWGLRTLKRRKIGGKPLTKSHLYHMFKHPFYFGYFYWKDAVTGETRLVKGNHESMITEQEYWRAQAILGKRGKPQPKTHEFAYTGLIKCGECQSSVTAEEKHLVICTVCRYKFTYARQTVCPKCSTDISEMENPKLMHYTYYHCTKKKDPKCSQRAIRLANLESQILEELEKITISEKYINEIFTYSKQQKENFLKGEKAIKVSLESALDDCKRKLKNLEREYLSVLNTNHELFTGQEFLEQKRIIMSEQDSLERKIDAITGNLNQVIHTTEKFFNFCINSKNHFINGDLQTRRIILSSLGSKLTLFNKKLEIERLNPYFVIEKVNRELSMNSYELETENSLILQEPNVFFGWFSTILCRTFDSVRNWIQTHPEFEVPDVDAL